MPGMFRLSGPLDRRRRTYLIERPVLPERAAIITQIWMGWRRSHGRPRSLINLSGWSLFVGFSFSQAGSQAFASPSPTSAWRPLSFSLIRRLQLRDLDLRCIYKKRCVSFSSPPFWQLCWYTRTAAALRTERWRAALLYLPVCFANSCVFCFPARGLTQLLPPLRQLPRVSDIRRFILSEFAPSS